MLHQKLRRNSLNAAKYTCHSTAIYSLYKVCRHTKKKDTLLGYTGDWATEQTKPCQRLPSRSLSQSRLAHSLYKCDSSNKHTNLPARVDANLPGSITGASGCLLALAQSRLRSQTAGRVTGLTEVGESVDLIRDASRPVRHVFGVRLAPVVAAGVVGLYGTLAAAGGHLLNQVLVGHGDGAHEVLLRLVGIGEAGDEGRRADGVGCAADCGGKG